MLIGLTVALVATNGIWLWVYLRAKSKANLFAASHANAMHLAAVCSDLNKIGVGLLEIRRVDPGSVFLYGMN